MKLSTVKHGINILARHPKVYFGRVQYLFILSHMRSYSSLLAHILGSHNQIVGHIERNRSYRNFRDLMRFRHHSYVQHKRVPKPYLLDKVLHNRYALSREIMNRTDVKLIYLLREPEATIKSIMNMLRVVPPEKDTETYQSPAWAFEYYRARLTYLENCIPQIRNRALLIDSKDIVQHTEAVLKTLTRWLDLEMDLSSEYQVFPETGVAGKGDPTDTIKEGVVLTGESNQYENIEVPKDILSRAREHYERCRQILCQHYDTVSIIPKELSLK